jgi:hypothetical protein
MASARPHRTAALKARSHCLDDSFFAADCMLHRL